MLVLSYGLEEYEPSICNQRLGTIADNICRYEASNIIVVAQWEVALAMPQTERPHVVWPKLTKYLSSHDVIDEAIEVFHRAGVSRVIVVAQPFLQLSYAQRQLAAEGFEVVDREIPRIGHNPRSLQPWTRHRLALLWYALRIRLGGSGRFISTQQIISFAQQHRQQASVSPERRSEL